MDTPDLAALAPAFMRRHPTFAWTVANPGGEALRLRISPRTHRDRLAVIEVNPGAEVFDLKFLGYQARTDFAYDAADKRDLFGSFIEDATALAIGPTRVIRRLANGVQVSCEVLIDPGSPRERSLGQHLSRPTAYARARLKGQRPTTQITTLPLISTS